MRQDKNFALLLFEEHPTGRAMLQKLIENHHPPQIIIQESSTLADTKREAYETSLTQDTPSKIAEMAIRHAIPIFSVPNHNDSQCIDILKDHHISLILLGNTRIIKPDLLRTAPDGVINVHPGYLPDIKGSYPIVWAVYTDAIVGCTSHFIDKNIDTGPIIDQTVIEVSRSDTIETLVEKSVWVSADLAVRAIQGYLNETLTSHCQDDRGQCYKWPDDTVISEAKAKLISGNYQHYAD